MTEERKGLDLSAEELERLMKDRFERPMPKRFYKTVTIKGDTPAFSITLDGRPVKTPMKLPLLLPTRALAEGIAAEWERQEERINPFDMPLTRLANAAIDRVRGKRDDVVGMICEHGEHDLLCYRADKPPAFAVLQAKTWDPLLAWAEDQLGERFAIAEGVMPVEQPGRTLAALRQRFSYHGDFQLAALSNIASLTGSAILALAMATGHLTEEEAWRAATLDEDWNRHHWGADAEAEAKLAQRKREFDSAARMLELLKAG